MPALLLVKNGDPVNASPSASFLDGFVVSIYEEGAELSPLERPDAGIFFNLVITDSQIADLRDYVSQKMDFSDPDKPEVLAQRSLAISTEGANLLRSAGNNTVVWDSTTLYGRTVSV